MLALSSALRLLRIPATRALFSSSAAVLGSNTSSSTHAKKEAKEEGGKEEIAFSTGDDHLDTMIYYNLHRAELLQNLKTEKDKNEAIRSLYQPVFTEAAEEEMDDMWDGVMVENDDGDLTHVRGKFSYFHMWFVGMRRQRHAVKMIASQVAKAPPKQLRRQQKPVMRGINQSFARVLYKGAQRIMELGPKPEGHLLARPLREYAGDEGDRKTELPQTNTKDIINVYLDKAGNPVQRNSHRNVVRRRNCIITGRNRGLIMDYRVSRIHFKEMCDDGILTGWKKKSW